MKYLDPEGVRRETTAEVHFGWVLEGRAIQDVWIAPSRHGRKDGERLLMHGSTFRVYDPQNDLWHITWIDPVKQLRSCMTGRKVGDEIVQEYRADDGKRVPVAIHGNHVRLVSLDQPRQRRRRQDLGCARGVFLNPAKSINREKGVTTKARRHEERQRKSGGIRGAGSTH